MLGHRAKLLLLALGIAVSVYGVSSLNADVGNNSANPVEVLVAAQTNSESVTAVDDETDSSNLANTFGLSVGGGALLGAAARSKAKKPVKRTRSIH